MGIYPLLACVAAVLFIGLLASSHTSGGGAPDEDDPNQFVRDELDPSNPNDLVHRRHQCDEVEHHHFHTADVED